MHKLHSLADHLHISVDGVHAKITNDMIQATFRKIYICSLHEVLFAFGFFSKN